MNVVHCKKYLVEVANKQPGVTLDTGGVQQDQEEANDERLSTLLIDDISYQYF